MPTVTAGDVTRLEQMIDRCQEELAPLKNLFPCQAGAWSRRRPSGPNYLSASRAGVH